MKKILFWNINVILILTLFFAGCKKDDPIPEPNPDEKEIPEASEVNKFIWEGLATYYYWVNDVPNLTNGKFNNEDSLNAFLNTYTAPEDLFYNLLYSYGTIDKWSFIVDNSQEIDNWITGISESMGYDFMLGYIGDTDNLFGFVRYVLKDTPADLAGIKRGDFFTTVDGTQLTLSNYQALLFTQKTYTLGMADIENNHISENGKAYTMTAVEVQENPILLDTVYTIDGTNIGYLVYNGFTSAYDSKLGNSYDILLNNTIASFKSKGIDKLILDLRYNGGGSVLTSIYLASMIYSTNTSQVFAEYNYNDLVQNAYKDEFGEDYFNFYFSDVISNEKWDIKDANGNIIQTVNTPETQVSSLNLDELYVITSSNTASASELLINGLSPYITVKQIGTNTTGKNVGSFTITLKDWYDYEDITPEQDWAMQPIVLKIANSDGYSDYINGLQPDIEAEEDFRELLPFGDTNETLLKVALDDIRGISTKSVTFGNIPLKSFKSSQDMSRFSKEMYVDRKMIPVKK